MFLLQQGTDHETLTIYNENSNKHLDKIPSFFIVNLHDFAYSIFFFFVQTGLQKTTQYKSQEKITNAFLCMVHEMVGNVNNGRQNGISQ